MHLSSSPTGGWKVYIHVFEKRTRIKLRVADGHRKHTGYSHFRACASGISRSFCTLREMELKSSDMKAKRYWPSTQYTVHRPRDVFIRIRSTIVLFSFFSSIHWLQIRLSLLCTRNWKRMCWPTSSLLWQSVGGLTRDPGYGGLTCLVCLLCKLAFARISATMHAVYCRRFPFSQWIGQTAQRCWKGKAG